MVAALPLSTTQRRIVWGVRALLALAFGVAGMAKLAGMPQMVQVFDAIGVGQWFRYVTGVVEVLGAVLVLSGVVGVLAAVWPAIRAARLPVLDAVRSE